MADRPVIAKVDFIVTLTYAGKSGSTIKIAYREFGGVNNIATAHPAFYFDLEYPLEDEGATTISYRDIQIEVIEATSMQIEFRVINDNNLSWLSDID